MSRRVPNGTHGGVRGRENLFNFPSYSILARMIEKYGDSIELGTAQKVALIYEWTNASGDRQDYILNLEYSRVA